MPDLSDMVFISFNKHVVALDRHTGSTIWTWKAPKGMSYAAVHVIKDQVIVSVMGYTYSIDPQTGHTRWENQLPGLGSGVACIASVYGSTAGQQRAAASEEANRSTSSASASTGS